MHNSRVCQILENRSGQSGLDWVGFGRLSELGQNLTGLKATHQVYTKEVM